MLSRFFLVSALLGPTATWAACTSQQVGTLTFSDCTAESHVLSNPGNPVGSGVALQPLSDKATRPAPRLVRPHEILNMGGQVHNATANTFEGLASAPGVSEANTATNKQDQSKAPKKSAK